MGRLKLTTQLRGSTLVETLVALTLVTIVMTVAWLTVEWVLRGSHQRESIEAELLINQIEAEFHLAPWEAQWQLDTMSYLLSATLEVNDAGEDLYTFDVRCETPTGRNVQRTSLHYLPNLTE